MFPTLKDGDQLLVLRCYTEQYLRRGQIVIADLSKIDSILDPKPSIIVKRVIGLSGDTVAINSCMLKELVIFKEISTLDEDGFYRLRLPSKHCYLRADGQGSDSLHWGPIPYTALKGIVIAKLNIKNER